VEPDRQLEQRQWHPEDEAGAQAAEVTRSFERDLQLQGLALAGVVLRVARRTHPECARRIFDERRSRHLAEAGARLRAVGVFVPQGGVGDLDADPLQVTVWSAIVSSPSPAPAVQMAKPDAGSLRVGLSVGQVVNGSYWVGLHRRHRRRESEQQGGCEQ
jgi:hypothetical protein